MEDLCERSRKLIHEELLSQDLDTLTYKDIRNISSNMDKARSSQLLPLPTDLEETHEALCAVQVQTSSKGQLLLVNNSEKNIVMFSCKTILQFLSSIYVLYIDGTFKSHRSFFTNYLQFMDSAMVTICHLHFSYCPMNIKHPMRMYSDIRCQRLQNLVWMFYQQLFMLTSKPPFTTQWQQCGQAVKLKHVVSI